MTAVESGWEVVLLACADDAAYACGLHAQLGRAARVFYVDALAPGDDRRRAMATALREARVVVLVGSRHTARDQVLGADLAVAIERARRDPLMRIARGESPAQSIDRICFAKDGLLRQEFGNVYASLFDGAELHELVVRALATRRRGLTRTELLATTKLPTGGWISAVLEELETSGFIMRTAQFGLAKKDVVYRLCDEHSLFHLHWIERHRGRAEGTWLRIRGSPAWRAWSGYSFESVCLKHVEALRWSLGIGAVQTEESTWRYDTRRDDESGAQIDLVIDRKDGCINLCEMKFVQDELVVEKAYAQALREKRETFRRVTRTKKTLFTTMVTSHGVAINKHRHAVVDASVTMEALFVDIDRS